MREQIIKQIVNALDENKKPFFREQDIQICLIEYFKKKSSCDYDNIYFEYHLKTDSFQGYLWENDKNIYIDIVIEKDNKFYPIEIKYKTIKQEFLSNIFGEENLSMSTEFHGAGSIGCYDLWKDVKRLEIVKDKFKNVQKGIILFVTNDKSYTVKPKNKNTGYEQFSLAEDKQVSLDQTLQWNKKLKISENRPQITFKDSYKIKWNELNCKEWGKKDDVQHYYFIL